MFEQLGADSLPLLFIVLSGLMVQMGRWLWKATMENREDTFEHVEELNNLKEKLRQTRSKLDRCNQHRRRWMMIAKYYQRRYAELVQPAQDPPRPTSPDADNSDNLAL